MIWGYPYFWKHPYIQFAEFFLGSNADLWGLLSWQLLSPAKPRSIHRKQRTKKDGIFKGSRVEDVLFKERDLLLCLITLITPTCVSANFTWLHQHDYKCLKHDYMTTSHHYLNMNEGFTNLEWFLLTRIPQLHIHIRKGSDSDINIKQLYSPETISGSMVFDSDLPWPMCVFF